MSTHNIGFSKIIFQLSSNFIKYTPYLFFCVDSMGVSDCHLSVAIYEPRHEKTCLRVSDQVRHKPGCAITEDDKRFEISDSGRIGIVLTV